jgi:hypothetical protein
MVKNKYILLFAILITSLSSCTMKESIQRDILINTDPMVVNIPIVTSLLEVVPLAEVSSKTDLNTLISQNTNQFSIADLRSFRISGFQMEIEDQPVGDSVLVDSVNNFKAFDQIRVQLKRGNNQLLDIGTINNSAMQSSVAIQIPITTTQELKDDVSGGNLTYVITGIARDSTTKIIKASAIAQYKLTLGM